MASSVYKNILEAVQSQIQVLSLAGIKDENIVIRKVAKEKKIDLPGLPGIVIVPIDNKLVNVGGSRGTNASDDIQYPVGILMLQTSNHDQQSDFDRYLLWHEQIIGKFVEKRLPGVTSVQKGIIDPRDTINATGFDAGLDIGGMVIRFLSRELRPV